MYNWVTNTIKLQRAVAKVGNEDEQVLIAEYVRIGGLLKGITDKVGELKKDAIDIAIESAVEPIVTPKKRGRPKKS